jgi:hypothetical protein
MTYQSPHGKIAGLRERLDTWIETLATDKTYPWSGTGIIDDLEVAAQQVEKIDTLFAAIKHGDDDHQNWLRDKIREHFNPVPTLPEFDL